MTEIQANELVLDDALLDRLFRFKGASMRETCRLLSRPEGLSLAQFRNPQTCDEVLKLFAGHHPDANRAALASQRSMHLICVILALPLAAAVQGLHCTAQAPAIILDQGLPKALVFSSGRCTPLHCPTSLLQQLLVEVLAPLWETVAGIGYVAQRLLWSNTAAVIEAVVGSFRMPNVEALRRNLFAERHWPDDSFNPMYGFLRTVPGPAGAPIMIRRICCLHHQLGEARPHCKYCPLMPGADISACSVACLD